MFLAFEVYSEDEKEVVVKSADQFNISNRLLSGTKRVENTMNAKQKYLLDLTGYPHLKNVLETTSQVTSRNRSFIENAI